jgi:hypothetical protein
MEIVIYTLAAAVIIGFLILQPDWFFHRPLRKHIKLDPAPDSSSPTTPPKAPPINRFPSKAPSKREPLPVSRPISDHTPPSLADPLDPLSPLNPANPLNTLNTLVSESPHRHDPAHVPVVHHDPPPVAHHDINSSISHSTPDTSSVHISHDFSHGGGGGGFDGGSFGGGHH